MKTLTEWFEDRFPSIFELVRFHATEYPTPPNLNYMWSFGAVIMFLFAVQVSTGIMAAMFYKPNAALAFDSIERYRRFVPFGWLLQSIHSVCPTFIFAAIYLHIGRGMYYGSYKEPREVLWWLGVLLLIVMMMESFMGYVLPWGQMSYWAGTVITGLASVVPFVGGTLVTWVRGDVFMSDATLNRFYSLHIAFFPLAVIGGLIVLHIMALHDHGSNNPAGAPPLKENKVPFYPYYVVKDLYVIALVSTVLLYIVFFYPTLFLEAENFQKANPLLTPADIKPEWYFLPFFSMLRAIPSKGLGALTVWGGMWLFFFLPFIDRSDIRSNRYRPVKKWLDAIFFINFIYLGYLGDYPPFGWRLTASKLATAIYFAYFALLFFVSCFEKKPDELTAFIKDPGLIKAHSARGEKNMYAVMLMGALGGLTLSAFAYPAPTRAMVDRGRAVYEAKGKMCHDMRDIGEVAGLSAPDRLSMLGVVPPDLSLMWKSMSGEGVKRYLDRFIGKTPPGSKMAVTFTPKEVDELAAFLQWSSDPSIFLRAKIGPWVTLFMSVFTALLYLLYRELWRT